MYWDRNKLAKAIGSMAAQPSSYIANDVVATPRIHPNGIPLYDSCSTSSKYLTLHKLATIISPINIVLFSHSPAQAVFLYGFLYYVCYVAIYINLDYQFFTFQKFSAQDGINTKYWGGNLSNHIFTRIYNYEESENKRSCRHWLWWTIWIEKH